MTSFAASDVVRCPHCDALALRQRFLTINLSGGLFPQAFRKIAAGEVICPHCQGDVDANNLPAIAVLDAKWKQWIWAGIGVLQPRPDSSQKVNRGRP